jgi:N-ethylmaleimide reductase
VPFAGLSHHLQTIDAIAARIGASRTAIRLSPYGGLFDMPAYAEIEETYLHLAPAEMRLLT